MGHIEAWLGEKFKVKRSNKYSCEEIQIQQANVRTCGIKT